MNTPFNPQMIAMAREWRGLTQEELATAISASQGYISKVEGGLKEVSPEYLTRIADELRFPPEFFVQPDEVFGVGSGCNYHRKRESLHRRDWYRITARLNLLRLHTSRLLRGIEIATTNRFYNFELDEYGSPERIAQVVRQSWKLPNGPVTNVIRAIERSGGIVLRMPFGTDKIDAISQSLAGQPPLFLVNSAIPGDRLRFTLSHEIGHIIMHGKFPTEDMEREADKFAAEFLMPAADIAPSLTSFTLKRAAGELKPYWKVSISALLRRAKDLRTITEQQYVNFIKRMSYLGYRKEEPVVIPHEEPTILRDIFKSYFEDMSYTQDELSKLIHFFPEETQSEYLTNGIRVLRVV